MNVDTSGILVLEEIHKRLLSRGVQVSLAWICILREISLSHIWHIIKFH